MSLTYGSGPFGQRPAGRFEPELPRDVVYVEELPRWIRGRLGGETVVDSKRPHLIHRHARLPVYAFPEEDVRLDLLPGDGVERDQGLVIVHWDALDEWFEEEERLVAHPRDPYSRIDVRQTSRRVTVSVGRQLVAESTRAKVLYEAGLPPRWYLPEQDVRMELLEPTDRRTACAYKGFASYWSVGDEGDIAWTYRDPLHDALPVKDMIAFFNERVDLDVDGEPQQRPTTQWSPGGGST